MSLTAQLRAATLFALVSAAACSGAAPTASSPLLDAPLASEGAQLTIATMTASGTDARVCKLVAVTSALTLGRVTSRANLGAHHVEVALTSLTATDVPDEVFNCADRVVPKLGTIYSANDIAGDLTFGADATLDLPAGTVLLVELHALNATMNPLDTSAAVNLYATAGAGPKMGSFEIAVPSSGVTCRISGSHFIQIVGGDPNQLDVSMTLKGADLPTDVPVFDHEPSDPLVFRPALAVDAGESIVVSCGAGPCTLRGTYFPATDDGLANCM